MQSAKFTHGVILNEVKDLETICTKLAFSLPKQILHFVQNDKGKRITKAHSGRELSALLTEGERVTAKFIKALNRAGSFCHPMGATFLSEEGF